MVPSFPIALSNSKRSGRVTKDSLLLRVSWGAPAAPVVLRHPEKVEEEGVVVLVVALCASDGVCSSAFQQCLWCYLRN